MELTSLGIDGAWLVTSLVHADERGSFREWFKFDDIKSATGLDFSVAQANLSESRRGVVRGIHYSLASAGQAKLVTCISGKILDVIVDIRPKSPTFRQHVKVELAGGSGHVALIGAGLGHGFISLEDNSFVAYLITSKFSPIEEYEINPLDPELDINWILPNHELLLSPKDLAAPALHELQSLFQLPN